MKLFVIVGMPVRFVFAVIATVIMTIGLLIMPKDRDIYENIGDAWRWVFKG